MFIVLGTVVGSLLCVAIAFLFYKTGKVAAFKESAVVNIAIVTTLKDLINTILKHSSEQMATYMRLIESKDRLIESYVKQTTDLKAELAHMSEFLEEDDDDEDIVEDDEDHVAVAVSSISVAATGQLFEKKTPAHVALELHAQIKDTEAMLENCKHSLPESAYVLLKSCLKTQSSGDVDGTDFRVN